MTQFIRCTFNPDGSGRQYTYANEGERLRGGERVIVEKGEGTAHVTVVAVDIDEPAFPCKQVKGLAPVKEEATP